MASLRYITTGHFQNTAKIKCDRAMRRPLTWQSMRHWTFLSHFSSYATFSRPLTVTLKKSQDNCPLFHEMWIRIKDYHTTIHQQRFKYYLGVLKLDIRKRRTKDLTNALQRAGRGPSEKEDFWRRCAACTPALTTAKGGGSEKSTFPKS